jgi:CSLREA domain-containing protein
MSMPPAQGVEFVVESAVDAIDDVPGDGVCASLADGCTLRAAVMEANALPGADTIRIPGGLGVSLNLTGQYEDSAATGDLDISEDSSSSATG